MKASLSVQSVVDALASAVRERILTGELAGGSPLTEKEVAEYYDVARPTAKAAIERLVYDGLLRRGANKTARVPRLGVDDVRDLYFCRGLIERDVAGGLADSNDVPLAAKAALEDFNRAVEQKEPLIRIVELDVAFHRALVDEFGSTRLRRLYFSIMGEMHLCMAQVQALHLLDPKVLADEHRAIMRAIEVGDRTQAVACVTVHLDRARDQLCAYLTKTAPQALGSKEGAR